MAMRMLQQKHSPEAILSALSKEAGISPRQAYRYIARAQRQSAPQPLPEVRTVFTVNLPQRLVREIRARCRREGRAISHVVADVLEAWLRQQTHG